MSTYRANAHRSSSHAPQRHQPLCARRHRASHSPSRSRARAIRRSSAGFCWPRTAAIRRARRFGRARRAPILASECWPTRATSRIRDPKFAGRDSFPSSVAPPTYYDPAWRLRYRALASKKADCAALGAALSDSAWAVRLRAADRGRHRVRRRLDADHDASRVGLERPPRMP